MRADRAALALVVLLAAGDAGADEAPEPDPLHVFLDEHPGMRGEELIDVAAGDGIDRVLAVVHNTESGLVVRALRVSEVAGSVAIERTPQQLAGRAGAEARGSYLVLLTQDCDERQPPPRMRPGSWLFLRANRLIAWDLVTYAEDCRPREERFEASDHDAMRVVGEDLFRTVGRGRFRYGALRYDAFEPAFVAPTREATLSLLRARAASAPSDAAVQNRLAVALYASGDRDGALHRLERAAALDPSAPDPHRNLATVYRQRGDRVAAEREETLAGAARPDPVYAPAPR
ncbi:MAG: hypothetical protein IT386_00130 [Deltaproteobacteria bacterium]|nr:hypothetical protein [Deltaproteobacteria bacterium]